MDVEMEPPQEFWYVGVILSIIGCLMAISGYFLQRWSHQRNSKLPPEQQLPPFKQWANCLGIALLGGEAIMEALALNYAAESLIASLGSISVVLNLILAPKLLGERMQQGDMTITMLVILGTTVCVLFSSHSDSVLTWDDLYSKFVRISFLRYFVVMLLLIGCLLVVTYKYQQLLAVLVHRLKLKQETVEMLRSPEFAVKVHRFTLPTIAAICAAFMNMLGKASVALLTDTIGGDNEFVHFGSWMIVFLNITFLVLQIKFLNESLRIYSALSIVPFYETMTGVFGILNGAMFYRDFDDLTVTQGFFFAVGIMINSAALVMLMRRSVPHEVAVEAEHELTSQEPKYHEAGHIKRKGSSKDYSRYEQEELESLATPREADLEEAYDEELKASPGVY